MKWKLLFIVFCTSTIQNISAQTGITTRYYDSSWRKTIKDYAYYVKSYERSDSNFQVTTKFCGSEKIYSIAYSKDTASNKCRQNLKAPHCLQSIYVPVYPAGYPSFVRRHRNPAFRN